MPDRNYLKHRERVLRHLEGQEMRQALQITAGWLAALAKEFSVDETRRATLRLNGKIIAETSLGEALDLANAALEPESV